MALLDAAVLPEFSAISVADRRAWFALRLRPRLALAQRGVRIVLALDRSSSMTGQKFEHARIAAMVVIQMMSDEDELAILTFDATVEVLLPPMRADAAGKRAAHGAILGLAVGEGTALYRATQQSLALAEQMGGGHAILLTDGFPFTGITDGEQILAMTAKGSTSATLTTIGVGSGLDAALLAAMAGMGGGRFLHVDEGGYLPATLGAELTTVRGAVTGKIDFALRAAPGYSISAMPHYASTKRASETPPLATGTLAPAVTNEEHLVPFELAWTSDLALGEQQIGLITLAIGVRGSTEHEVLEVPVMLRVDAARGAMSAVVTCGVCEVVAGKVLHDAGVGEESARRSVRRLGDAAAWIRGRASAAGLDPERDLGPMLRVLGMARAAFEENEADVPVLHACAAGIAKRYDASVGSRSGLLGDLRSEAQSMGSDMGTNIGSRIEPIRPKQK